MKNPGIYNMILLLAFLAVFSCTKTSNLKQAADLIIHNAKITTLEERVPEAEAIAIKGNHIISTGLSSEILKYAAKHTKIIDAEGRRIIPGLIDSHAHFLRQGNMPGNLVQDAENVRSVGEMIQLLKSKSETVEKNKLITIIGGFVLKQLSEERLPSIGELSDALPEHPVFIQVGFDGPCVVNQKAKEKLEDVGLVVNKDGFFKKGKASMLVFRAIQGFQRERDQVYNLKGLMEYANSLGLTGIHDEGGTNFPNSSAFNTFSDYNALQQLRKEDDITLRFRIQHVVYDKDSTDNLLEQKLNNTWQGFGDDMVKYWTAGEHIVSFPMDGKVNPLYLGKVKKVAQKGWTHEQHSVNYEENIQHLTAIKKVNEQYDIQKLRWSLSHVFELGHPKTLELVKDLKELHMGLKVQNHGYYVNTDKFPLGRSLGFEQSGPLYRTLISNDIPMGAGTDGPLLGPLNPWYSLFYMVTGKDINDKLVNADETISRLDALRLYTLGSAWHAFDEDKLGSLEEGKLADLVIIDKDYFTITEEEIKDINSVLTIVDGNIVYSKLD